MGKYRKVPVVIDAFQYKDFMLATETPQWFQDELKKSVSLEWPDGVYVTTLEGDMKFKHNDWIIRGVVGELYPCRPDIFKLTYEPVKE